MTSTTIRPLTKTIAAGRNFSACWRTAGGDFELYLSATGWRICPARVPAGAWPWLPLTFERLRDALAWLETESALAERRAA